MQIRLNLAIPRSRLLVLAEPGGCAGGFTQSTPLLLFSRWLQVFIFTWVVHVYSCPGLTLFCLPIDTAPTWHLLPLHVALPLWFRPLVALFGPGSAGWDTVGRMGGFLCLPLLGATVRTRTPLIPLCLRFAWFAPSCGFCIFSPALVHATCVRVSSRALLASCRVLDFLWPHRGMPETLNFTPLTLAFGLVLGWCAAERWDWLDPRSCGGRMQPLQLCLPPARSGSPFPGGFLVWWRVRGVAFRLR